ncbi:GlsB/YeaQ/YmgE family stress response membrane protein [Candidatus Kaiserbacteria bacterium]|nr:MAG: GlsB/YeaQ/YmgE family stress response membrane protein [Candidatus Kaiserbacteria bacterium]
MSILLWILFGGLVGWIASLIMGTDGQQGIILNIVVGIIGSSIGGYIMHALGKGGVGGFTVRSFAVGVIGAVVLIAIFQFIRG